eukprot:TRINITY_DN11661_c0_g7_i2.p1 TRINITY_DN11661_c0_g7~~TRINITY_DN11661_c0_g7_i2.p1  ORF type:complete len:306 (+),score=71.60 TRINITY_DN11661_c0_g7_i2:46-963(+)
MTQAAWSTLTPGARAETEKLFQLYDADGSGAIDHAEFMSICRSYEVDVKPEPVLQSFRSVAGPKGMDRNGLAMWLMSAFGATEQAYFEGVAALIRSAGAGVASILPTVRRKKAHKLFLTYDLEQQGFLDTRMFTELCQQYDPSISPEGVAKTFEMVHATNGIIDVVSFYRWIAMMFGECTNEEFAIGMEDLLDSAALVSTNKGISPECHRWANKLFSMYDKSHSGFLSVADFASLCRQYDPTLSDERVSLTFQQFGGAQDNQIKISEFVQWCVTMFGTGEAEFLEAIKEPISESCNQMSLSLIHI